MVAARSQPPGIIDLERIGHVGHARPNREATEWGTDLERIGRVGHASREIGRVGHASRNGPYFDLSFSCAQSFAALRRSHAASCERIEQETSAIDAATEVATWLENHPSQVLSQAAIA